MTQLIDFMLFSNLAVSCKKGEGLQATQMRFRSDAASHVRYHKHFLSLADVYLTRIRILCLKHRTWLCGGSSTIP